VPNFSCDLSREIIFELLADSGFLRVKTSTYERWTEVGELEIAWGDFSKPEMLTNSC